MYLNRDSSRCFNQQCRPTSSSKLIPTKPKMLTRTSIDSYAQRTQLARFLNPQKDTVSPELPKPSKRWRRWGESDFQKPAIHDAPARSIAKLIQNLRITPHSPTSSLQQYVGLIPYAMRDAGVHSRNQGCKKNNELALAQAINLDQSSRK